MSEVNNGNNGRQRFVEELRRVREVAGLTQEQMAARLGMGYAPGGRRVSTGRAAVSAWESGKRRPPTEIIKAYIGYGGDPAVLTVRPDTSRQPLNGRPAVAESGDESSAAVSPAPLAPDAGADPADRRRRLWLRWRWLTIATVLVLVAAGVSIYSATRGSGSTGPTGRTGLTGSTGSTGPTGPASTWTETTGTPAHTWADPVQLTGAGTPLGPRQSIQVLCRVRGYVVQDGDPWWYLIASRPWDEHYYATSDAFYNNGAVSGSVDTGVVVDEQVPVCAANQH